MRLAANEYKILVVSRITDQIIQLERVPVTLAWDERRDGRDGCEVCVSLARSLASRRGSSDRRPGGARGHAPPPPPVRVRRARPGAQWRAVRAQAPGRLLRAAVPKGPRPP